MANKFKVGDKVVINLSSEFRHQGLDKEDKLKIGEVFEVTGKSGLCNRVRWGRNDHNSYGDRDLELVSSGSPQYEIY